MLIWLQRLPLFGQHMWPSLTEPSRPCNRELREEHLIAMFPGWRALGETHPKFGWVVLKFNAGKQDERPRSDALLALRETSRPGSALSISEALFEPSC